MPAAKGTAPHPCGRRKTAVVLALTLGLNTAAWFALPRLAVVFPILWQVSFLGNLLLYAVWAVSVFAACRMTGRGMAWLGLSREGAPRQMITGMALGVLTAFGFTLLLLLVGRGAGLTLPQILSASAPGVPALLLNLAWYLLVVGPAEELAFRGYLFHALSDVTGAPVPAALLSSLLFGLIHLRGGSLLQVFSTTLLGLIYTLPLLRGGRPALLLSMSAHSAHNAVLELLRWFFC